jgi:hypothetical protein
MSLWGYLEHDGVGLDGQRLELVWGIGSQTLGELTGGLRRVGCTTFMDGCLCMPIRAGLGVVFLSWLSARFILGREPLFVGNGVSWHGWTGQIGVGLEVPKRMVGFVRAALRLGSYRRPLKLLCKGLTSAWLS